MTWWLETFDSLKFIEYHYDLKSGQVQTIHREIMALRTAVVCDTYATAWYLSEWGEEEEQA